MCRAGSSSVCVRDVEFCVWFCAGEGEGQEGAREEGESESETTPPRGPDAVAQAAEPRAPQAA